MEHEAGWPSTIRFEAGLPEDHRDPVPPDVGFLRACGVRPEDIRDSLLVLDQ